MRIRVYHTIPHDATHQSMDFPRYRQGGYCDTNASLSTGFDVASGVLSVVRESCTAFVDVRGASQRGSAGKSAGALCPALPQSARPAARTQHR